MHIENNKIKYFVIFLFMLIICMSVAVAADVNDTTDSTQIITKDTTQITDTNVITTKEVKNEPQIKEITKTEDTKTKENNINVIEDVELNNEEDDETNIVEESLNNEENNICISGDSTQQTQIKKTNTNIKSDDEEKTTTFTVTQENYASIGTNFQNLFKNYPELNDYDTIIMNITYWENPIITVSKKVKPNSPKHFILTYTENLSDKQLTGRSTDLFTMTVENVTVKTILDSQGQMCNAASVQTITFKNCVFNASTDEELRPSYFATSDTGIVIFDNCTITTGAYSFIAPTQGSLVGFLKGIEIKNSNIEINCEEQAYDYFFDYGVPKDNYDTNPSNIQSINITNNNITLKGMKGIKVVTNATTLIENNTITIDSDYAIEITGNENIVRNNTLIAKTLQGNDAVLVTGTDNIVENNGPMEIKESEVTVSSETLEVGDTATLTAVFYAEDGKQIQEGKVVFKVNGKTLKDENGKTIYTKITDGTATTTYKVPENMSGKDINITAVYSGSSKYEKQTVTTTATVAQATPTLTITPFNEPVTTGSTITLKAKVTLADTPITTGKIVFKINGKTVKDANGKVIYAKVDTNGEVSVDYNIGNLKSNDYLVTATFISSDYDKVENNTTMTVINA